MKNKYLKCSIYIVCIIIFIFLLFLFINDDNKIILKKIKSGNDFVSKIIYYPIYKNNKKTDMKNAENKVLRKEIEELKKELKLKKTLTDKKIISANTIRRSSSYWYNTITIDIGKKENVKKGNLVINNSGVLGHIIRVNKNSSEVKLLTTKKQNNYISVMFIFDNKEYYGFIDKYNVLKNEFHLKNVVGDFDKLENVNVYTSGLSKNNVKGILIGKIKKYKKTNYGISNDIYITPSANFNNINVVEVLIN